MMLMKSKDFSFVGEKAVGQLYHLFEEMNFKPNLTQNAAITFLAVVDDKADKIERLALAASEIFDVELIKGLSLLTIRHYNKEIFEKLTRDITIILRQQTTDTIQVLMNDR
jgi:aspartate kinase